MSAWLLAAASVLVIGYLAAASRAPPGTGDRS